MKKIKILWVTAILLLFVACEKDDQITEEESIKSEAVLHTIKASKVRAYIDDDPIVVSIVGRDYDSFDISSSDQLDIEKLNDFSFQVSADKTTSGTISVRLKDQNGTPTKNSKKIVLSFYEHGVKHNAVEGFRIDRDKSDLVKELMGEPAGIAESDNHFFWSYPEKGIGFSFRKSDNTLGFARLYSSKFIATINNTKIPYNTYPYAILDDWYITGTTMKSVVKKLGTPKSKTVSSQSTLKIFDYQSIDWAFYFISDSFNNYSDKLIESLLIY